MAEEKVPDEGSPLASLDDATLPFFTIGQVAQVLGIQPSALRRFDEEDIVSPDRSEGGQRRYSRAEVERLREVLDLTGEGLTLAGVRMVLELREQINDLQDTVNGLEAAVGDLKKELARARAGRGAGRGAGGGAGGGAGRAAGGTAGTA
jgi:MerR family transcriptional regulator/heat shock protein HspR